MNARQRQNDAFPIFGRSAIRRSSAPQQKNAKCGGNFVPNKKASPQQPQAVLYR